jgi:DNA repair protein RecO
VRELGYRLPGGNATTTLSDVWEGDDGGGRRRNWILPAVVLRSMRVADIHRSVTLFTSKGIARAMAHGAAKATSRLKPATMPFSYITAYLYHDPVRDSLKVTDVDSLAMHQNLSANLVKYFTASLWSEVIISSHGGGAQPTALQEMLIESLARLDSASAEEVPYLSAAFLWYVLEHLGVAPETDTCESCGRALPLGEDAQLLLAVAAVLCGACSHATGDAAAGPVYALDAGLRALIHRLRDGAGRVALGDDWDRLRRALQQLMQHALERPLQALACAAGII